MDKQKALNIAAVTVLVPVGEKDAFALIPPLAAPVSIPGIVALENESSLPLFQTINETTLRLNNPHFVHVFCLKPQKTRPTCDAMTTIDAWVTNGLYDFWSGIPSNSGGNSRLAWGDSWPAGAVDWREGGSFDIKFPENGVYWIQSRGPDLTLQSFVFDTRWLTPQTPTGLTAQDIGSQKAKFTWVDTSSNEAAFHIIPQQLVGEKWVKLPYIRANKDTNTVTWQGTAGYYRFSIRSALSNAEENWTFQRRVSVNPSQPLDVVNFTTPAVIKYSPLSGYTYLLINGTFPNPIAPTNFGGALKPDNSIYFVWQDNSNNESVFHILEDKWVVDASGNGSWVRQLVNRIPSNRSSYTLPARPTGKYRFCIRSAYSFPSTNIVRTSGISNWIEFTIP
jgi:hypothetical protein